MFETAQKEFNQSVRKMAEHSLLKKLNAQGISRNDIDSARYEMLLEKEIEIIKMDGKKVGTGIGIGVALTLLTGGIF
jgi:hypothetical protein